MNTMLNPWPGSFLDPMPWMTNPFAFCMPRAAVKPLPAVDPRPVSRFVRCHYTSAHGSLTYKLFIPSSYCGAPLPLLVMLHGCGQDADDFARGTDMNSLAEEMACIVAYPEQSSAVNSNRCWNWFEDAHQHRDHGEPALLAGIAQEIIAEFAIDTARVFVAGLSAGGAMAVVLARNYPELFTAVGCHSGLAYACATDLYAALDAMRGGPKAAGNMADGEALPIIVFHGDRDSTVHPRNGASVVEQFVECGQSAEVPMLAERGEATGRSFTRQIFQSDRGQVLAEQWVVHGSGHAWSGGNRRGSYTDASGPSASAEMMRFFLSHSLQ